MTAMIKTNPAYQMPFSITEFLRTSFHKIGSHMKSLSSRRADSFEFRRLAARDDLYLRNSGLNRSDMAWTYNLQTEKMSPKNLGMIGIRSN
jgi:hypothetical protein